MCDAGRSVNGCNQFGKQLIIEDTYTERYFMTSNSTPTHMTHVNMYIYAPRDIKRMFLITLFSMVKAETT